MLTTGVSCALGAAVYFVFNCIILHQNWMPSCWEMSQDMWSRKKYNFSPCNGDMIFHKTYKEKSVQFAIFEHYKLYSHLHFNWIGAFVVMIVWYLDLQLPMQSMPITTKAVSWHGVLDATLFDKVCQWLPTVRWFSLGTPVSSTNKTDHHDITEILLKVTLNTINHSWMIVLNLNVQSEKNMLVKCCLRKILIAIFCFIELIIYGSRLIWFCLYFSGILNSWRIRRHWMI